MNTATISVEVDADTARAYEMASPQERRKLQLLVRLQLQDWLQKPARPLAEIMDEIGQQAIERGLTPNEFANIADHVLQKNAELYRRLAECDTDR